MRNYVWKILLVAFVILVCSYGIVPPREKLKLGKDLAGGVTLTYTIAPDDEGNLPAEGEVDQIITVLLERIDPNGVYDISITPQGRNQLEISMPLPTPDVIAARNAFEAMMDELGETSLQEGEIQAALRQPPGEQRQEAIDALVRGVPEREAALQRAAEAFDAAAEARERYNALFAQRSEAVEPLEERVDTLSVRLDEAMTAIRDAGVSSDRTLALTTTVDDEARDEVIAEIIRQNPDAEFAVLDWLDARTGLDEARAELQAAEAEWLEQLEPAEDAAARAQVERE
ncbi:MAG: hypothetical protein ACOC0P_05110, partial [Planctomycetota bacterium]